MHSLRSVMRVHVTVFWRRRISILTPGTANSGTPLKRVETDFPLSIIFPFALILNCGRMCCSPPSTEPWSGQGVGVTIKEEGMVRKTLLAAIVLCLFMAGTASAQHDETVVTNMIPGKGFIGVVDKVDGEYVLDVGDRVFLLEHEDKEMLEGLVGQEVEVIGSLEEDTIQAEQVGLSEGGW
jgi:hypothetical protein